MSQLVEPNAIEEKRLVQLVVSKGRELSYKNLYIELGGFVSVFLLQLSSNWIGLLGKCLRDFLPIVGFSHGKYIMCLGVSVVICCDYDLSLLFGFWLSN